MTSHLPALALPAIVLEQLSARVAAHTALHFPPDRWLDLERGLAAAALQAALPLEDYAQELLTLPWTKRRIEILASYLTVGETYFFRHREALAAFEQRILPDLIRARRQQGRHIRIWSAGCCSGEEAYSLAILLRQLLPDWRDWTLHILATDINPLFLEKARQGLYREWSFRETDALTRRIYFESRDQESFEILPEIREMVHFDFLNLAQDPFPSPENGTAGMDVIFCRNVLMYFSAARAAEVVRGLRQSLVEGGWLVVGPSETSQVLFSEFDTVHSPGVVLYQKGRRTPALRTPPDVAPLPASASPPAVAPLPAFASPPAATTIPALAPVLLPTPVDAVARARECADRGKLAEALQWSERAVAADKMDPQGHYLQAAILQEQGQDDTAAAALKRALYLDPDFALAHFALGNLRRRQGKWEEAARHFDHAVHILGSRPREQVLSEPDGLTAGRLLEIIQSMSAVMK